jgi:hypothetical protein
MAGTAWTEEEFISRVRDLRSAGVPPKAIARTLGVQPARVAPVIRTLAAEAEAAAAGEGRPVVGCWINPGWSAGLKVDGHPEWPTGAAAMDGALGLVSVMVARQAARGRVRLFGYLVDVFCLGVKDVIGPKVLDPHLVDGYLRSYYESFECLPMAVPLSLVQHVVFGAIEYARGLGLQPAKDFTREAAEQLGEWRPPSAVTFGHEGRPLYVEGPRDKTAQIMRTLRSTVGDDNFDYIAGVRP